MSYTETLPIKEIASHESDFLRIYRQVHPVLKKADRSQLSAAVIADLDNLDLPDTIQPAKAAAILKSIVGSTSQDKFAGFENCYGTEMSDGTLLGSFVKDQLGQIGICYTDLCLYLYDRGWLKYE